MDSNHGPRPYQGRALTKLSYAPNVSRGKLKDAVIISSNPKGASDGAGNLQFLNAFDVRL